MSNNNLSAAVNSLVSKFELVDVGDGMGGLFVKPDGTKFKERAKSVKKEKNEKIAAFRKEASRLAAMANKRVARMESNGLQDAPAYKGYIESGGGKFSVKGKTHNQLQVEVSRMKKFITAKTSTITGVNNYLKGIATNTGIKYTNMNDLRAKANNFFALSAKVEEYLRTVEDIASAIGYQKIWEAVNVYVQDANIDLSDANLSIDSMIEVISKALTEHQTKTIVPLGGLGVYEATNWFKLTKD